jgi:Family of unknown function (DUF5681)
VTSAKGGPPPDGGGKPGYGRPPRHAQFKPGKSGNPKGRPKGSRSFETILLDLLNKTLPVHGANGTRKVTVREAIMMKFTENALKGDLRALLTLIALDEKSRANGRATGVSMPVSEGDMALLNSFLRRSSTEAKNDEGDGL